MEIVLYTYTPFLLISFLISIELWKVLVKKYANRKRLIFCVLGITLSILYIIIIGSNFPMWVGGLPPYLSVYFSIIIVSIYTFILTLRTSRKALLKIAMLLLVINSLSTMWFIPFNIGFRGEVAVCKFRFQVYEYDCHDYGTSHILDNVFCYNRNQCGKYGCIIFYDKIGGWKEYFGFQGFEFELRE